MKKFNILLRKGYLLGALVLVSSSCTKDLLETTSLTDIPYENAFDTPDRVLAQVNRLYALTKNANFLGGRGIVFEEIRSNAFLVNQPNPITGLEIWTQGANSSTAGISNIWGAGYTAINACNLFIDGVQANNAKISATLLAQYIAEAKFVRALCYTYLVQAYALPYAANNGTGLGLPLRLKGEIDGANSNLARSTVAEVYTQILKDLDEAEVGLPLSFTTALLNTTRANRNTAIALKTRVNLIKGDYAKVITEASKIVSAAAPFQAPTGVANRLEAVITTVFAGTYAGPEAMLSFPFTTVDGLGAQSSLSYYFSSPPGNTEYYLNPTGILANPAFSSTADARSSSLTVTYNGNRWLQKFKSASPYAEYIPSIRYAEVLLNYAEAAARTGNLAKATDLLNAVRKRSSPTYVFASADIATQDALVNTIITERRIELLGEGFSAFDLLRTLQPIPAKSGIQGVAPSVLPTASNYIWPMPASEASTNNLLQPNP